MYTKITFNFLRYLYVCAYVGKIKRAMGEMLSFTYVCMPALKNQYKTIFQNRN